MTPQAQLLMQVAEDLRRIDPQGYAALEVATRQGCATLMQIEIGENPQVSLGFRDDYGKTRWVHAISLQTQH